MALKLFASISPARLRLYLHIAGLAVLLMGYISAALVWRAQGHPAPDNIDQSINDTLATLDSKKTTRQIEVYYGKGGVFMERVTEFLQSLTHGKRLAETLVVLSSAAAISSFLVAGQIRNAPARR